MVAGVSAALTGEWFAAGDRWYWEGWGPRAALTPVAEDAVSLETRFLYDDKERGAQRLLHEEQPLCCISCGKPFATRSVIDKISGSLRGHPNFGRAEFRRIQMCEDCRVKDMFQAELDPSAESRQEARS